MDKNGALKVKRKSEVKNMETGTKGWLEGLSSAQQVTKEAVALKYSPEKNNAPEVIAMGKGEIAEQIVKKAKENDVPIYQDEKLAQTLSRLKIGEEIPPELYDVVAEILIFIGRIDQEYGERYEKQQKGNWKNR